MVFSFFISASKITGLHYLVLQALVGCQIPGLSYHNVLKMLVNPSEPKTTPLHKQAFHSLAKCVAAITVIYRHEALMVVEQFFQEIVNTSSDSQHIFALFIIGEIGRHM